MTSDDVQRMIGPATLTGIVVKVTERKDGGLEVELHHMRSGYSARTVLRLDADEIEAAVRVMAEMFYTFMMQEQIDRAKRMKEPPS